MTSRPELRQWWWRASALGGWLQLVSGADLRVVSADTSRRPVLVTSFDLLGNVSFAVAGAAFRDMPAAARCRLVAGHHDAVRRETERLQMPDRAIRRLVFAVRALLFTVLTCGPIAEDEVTTRLAKLTLIVASGVFSYWVAPWLVRRVLHWYVRRLLRHWV